MTRAVLRRPPAWALSLGCVLLCVVGCFATVSLHGERGGVLTGGAGGTVRQGLGHQIAGDFVGFFIADGLKVYCLTPRSRTPRTVSEHTVAHYPGVSRAAGSALAYALAQWGDATTRDAAVVESQVVNTLAGNDADVARRARSLPASLRRRTSDHVAEARIMRGPYTVKIQTSGAPQPGGSGAATITVTSASGAGVPGADVVLNASGNVRLAGRARTDAHGIARVGFDVTDVGEIRLSALVENLASTSVRVSRPAAGEQTLATAANRTSVRATATVGSSVAGFTHTYECTSVCDGHPDVTLAACVTASKIASRIVFHAAGRDLVLVFGSSTRGACQDLTTPLADGTTVTADWQYRTPAGWSRTVGSAGRFVVDCPLAPTIRVALDYDCVQASVSAELTAGQRTSVLEISGDREARVVAQAGKTATWTIGTSCGEHLHLAVRGGAQRADESWNYGRTADVITP